MAICGFLVRTSVLSLWPAYIALVIGDFMADIIWYFLGSIGGLKIVNSKFGKFMGLNESKVELIRKYYHKYHSSILFISKLTTGFGFAPVVLFTAGLVKIPFKKYSILNFFGGFIWCGALMALGYTFSHLFITIQDAFGKVTLIGASLFLIILVFRIGKYFHKIIASGNLQNK